MWLYPASSELKPYKNPGWDINAGIKTIGTGKFKPKVDEYYKIKLSVRGSDIKVYYDDKLEIGTRNKSQTLSGNG